MGTYQVYLTDEEEKLISIYKKRGETIPYAIKRLIIEKLRGAVHAKKR